MLLAQASLSKWLFSKDFLLPTENPRGKVLPTAQRKMKRAGLCRNTKPTLDPQPSHERMKIMSHSSATALSETPQLNAAIKRRAQALINNHSIDPETRSILRYGLEIDDPSLADLVRRVDDGENIVDNLNLSPTGEEKSVEEKIVTLAEVICRTGQEPGEKAAALLVMMAMLEDAAHPKALANLAKHFAFTRCGELNHCGILDTQIAAFARALFPGNALAT